MNGFNVKAEIDDNIEVDFDFQVKVKRSYVPYYNLLIDGICNRYFEDQLRGASCPADIEIIHQIVKEVMDKFKINPNQ